MKQPAYNRTARACFVGIFVQAIVTNITAILFIPMMGLYGLDYIDLGVLVATNFTAQVLADVIFSGAIDRVGYRRLVLPATLLAFLGLLLFALAPILFAERVFYGLLAATVVFSFSSGLLEVLLSPLMSALPDRNKGPAMGLLHSFYAWGQIATIVLTTLLLFALGSRSWQVIVALWALVPLVNFALFVRAPFPETIPPHSRQRMREILLHPFYMLALLAIFLGAGAEIVMNQWASAFMEKGLSLPKLSGDLIGMCGFAAMMGLGRMLYGMFGARINVFKVMILGSLLATACYIAVAVIPDRTVGVAACIVCGLAVSLLWPGTIVIASDRFPMGGAWIFAALAVAGDIGAAVAPLLTGYAIDAAIGVPVVAALARTLGVGAEQAALRFGIMVATLFPVLALICHCILYRLHKKKQPL